MSDLSQILQALGQVQGKLETLETNQVSNASAVRADVQAIHARIERLGSELKTSQENLFRDGCSHAGDHVDHEARIREVEDWKITHDTEARTVAASAGAQSGGAWGGGIAAAVVFLEYWIQRLGKS